MLPKHVLRVLAGDTQTFLEAPNAELVTKARWRVKRGPFAACHAAMGFSTTGLKRSIVLSVLRGDFRIPVGRPTALVAPLARTPGQRVA